MDEVKMGQAFLRVVKFSLSVCYIDVHSAYFNVTLGEA
jgi:hypothetical protein